MPFFSSSSGVQVNGGNFYDIAGDINVRSVRPVGSTQSANRLLSGPDRRDRHMGRSARLPYDVSRRPQILGSSCSDELHGRIPTSATTEMGLLPSISEADRQSFSRLELESQQSSARDHHTNWRNDPYLGPSTHRYPSVLRSISGEAVPENLNPSQYPPGDLDSPHDRIHSLTFPGDLGGPPNVLIGSATGARDSRQPEPKTSINGGTFISGNVNHIQRRGETGFHILYRAAANDASHDSGERYPPPRCHPETRMDMLDDLRTWSFGNDPESRVLWLHGPAGAGKSAIAQSFCQKLESEGRLGGSFFFKRGHPSRGNASKLFPTLAYQLAVLLPEFKRGVIQRVEEDPSIVDKSHSIQLQKLIIEPFQDTGLTLTLIMVIDGLDECQGQDIQQEVLRSIGNSFQRSHLPLRLLVASRPEPHIVEVFRRSYFTGFHRPLNIQKSLEDVRRYLQDGFRQIHREHWITMATVSSPWPSQEVINHLVEKSSGYFIYASTVIKFIDDKNFCPAERLEIIMGIAEPESESPFAALDQLYIQILAAVPSRSQLLRILTVITSGLISSSVARHHGGQRRSEIAFVQQLLDLKSGGVLLALRGLHSVIKVDEDATQFPRGPELNVYHASFLDFLNDSTRSGVFYVGGAQRTQLACDILKTFCYTSHDPTANSQNREGHLAWKLGPEGIAYLSSARPSSELLSRLHAVNPDFLFYGESMREPTEKVLDLLKEIRPQPQDLIQLWEDYCFMLLNADLWGDTYERRGNVSHGQLDHCQMVLQACPQVSRYFHAFRLVFNKWELNSRPLGIFDIRLLLNWSWDDTIAAFSRLRAILGPNSSQKVRGLLTYVFSADSVLSRKFCSSLTLRDLARTCLRTMKRLVANNFRWEPIHRSIGVWTYLLRSCPPCPDLLDELALVSSSGHIFHYFAVDDIYNVVQWLKMFPQCPAELIARYEQHLETILMANTMLGAMYYWRKWQKNLTQCDCFALQSNCGS